MTWAVEYTDEFGAWWETLSDPEREEITAVALLLEEHGPTLPFPYSSGIAKSRHPRMRELRIQVAGKPYRVLYAFNPLRTAILLIGGAKGGDDRWYDRFVPLAYDLYDAHLAELKAEGKLP